MPTNKTYELTLTQDELGLLHAALLNLSSSYLLQSREAEYGEPKESSKATQYKKQSKQLIELLDVIKHRTAEAKEPEVIEDSRLKDDPRDATPANTIKCLGFLQMVGLTDELFGHLHHFDNPPTIQQHLDYCSTRNSFSPNSPNRLVHDLLFRMMIVVVTQSSLQDDYERDNAE